ncbi:MAG TPA: hypothetical protein PKI46_09125, partial [Bacteroidales bacterium]|nr:hypothetical protein [Bacteroidales bacterium]
NIGRSNETTPEQQAINEAKSRADRKLEQGYYSDIKDAGKGKQFVEAMLAHKYEQYGEQIISEYEIYCQPKLDGIRCIATREGLFSRNGKQIVSAPHIFESAKLILNAYPEIEALDGELYNHVLKADFNKITSLVKKTKPKKEDLIESEQLVQYHVYDLVLKQASFAQRLDILHNIFGYQYIHIVHTEKVLERQFLDDIYAKYLKDGYEGQMIRTAHSLYEHKRTKNLLKRKEFQDEDCELIDIVEGNGNRSGMAGNVRCKHPNGNIFDANMRGGEEFYKELLLNKENYIGKKATIRYQNLTPDGIPRFPVMVSIRDYE